MVEPEAKSSLVAIGGSGAGDPFESEFVDVFYHWFLIGRGEDPELKKGIAQCFVDEMQHERVDGDHSA